MIGIMLTSFIDKFDFPSYIVPYLITSKLYLKYNLSVRMLALGGEMARDAFLYVQLMPALVAATRLGPAGLESEGD
jgi:hypothetical protein